MQNKIASILSILLFVVVIGILAVWKEPLKYLSRATAVKANIVIDSKKIVRRLPYNWKSLAQGGEEQGVRMFENVILPVSALEPRYIRIDHIYDFYNVVGRDNRGQIVLNWQELDATVCDIYRTQAKPFFVLGYMPEALSGDTSLVSKPKNWEEWAYVVQKTIERYSGRNTRLCGQVTGEWFEDIYYEVWNEPDLETFGKWSLYGGEKDYKVLYRYSVLGASRATNVYRFFIGGPATTAAYRNWFQVFLRYVKDNNLRIDFLSWHHYSKNTDDYARDMQNIDSWLSGEEFARYRELPRIISEWGYDSNPNPIADTNVGAAHTVSVIRNLIEEHLEMAFAFEVKDGPSPRWGILSYEGQKKPRYHALKMLNKLEGYRLKVNGEGTYVKAIASRWVNKIVVVLVNYDEVGQNIEAVPVRIVNLDNGTYELTTTRLTGETTKETLTTNNGQIQKTILMDSNSVLTLELEK